MTDNFEWTTSALNQFHDMTLLSIALDWASGTVVISIRIYRGMKKIVIEGATRLSCLREFPWGKSVCINGINLTEIIGTNRYQFDIEVQSGDVLTVQGAAVRVEDMESPG